MKIISIDSATDFSVSVVVAKKSQKLINNLQIFIIIMLQSSKMVGSNRARVGRFNIFFKILITYLSYPILIFEEIDPIVELIDDCQWFRDWCRHLYRRSQI